MAEIPIRALGKQVSSALQLDDEGLQLPRFRRLQVICLGLGVLWIAICVMGTLFLAERRVEKEITKLTAAETLNATAMARHLDQRFVELSNLAAALARQNDVISIATQFSERNSEFANNAVETNYPILRDAPSLASTADYFDDVASRLALDQIYLLNKQGLLITSTMRQQPDVGIGRYYPGRDYFQNALSDGEAWQFAIGRSRTIPGFFFSARVMRDGQPVGVLVVRQTTTAFYAQFGLGEDKTLLVDRAGMVIASSDESSLLHYAGPHFGPPPAGRRLSDVYRQSALQRLEALSPTAEDTRVWSWQGEPHLLINTPLTHYDFSLLRLSPLNTLSRLYRYYVMMGWIVGVAGLLGILLVERSLDYATRRRLHARVLAQANRELERVNQYLYELATRDALTGSRNRRYFMERLTEEVSRRQRYGRPAALLILDIDFFKKVNDTYGHPMGDAAIKNLAVLCKECVRPHDTVSRLGGEEFGVLLPEATLEAATTIAERLRLRVESCATELDGVSIHYTVSIGVAEASVDMTADAWLSAADQALYAAKHAGRNQVATQPNTPTGHAPQ